MFDHFKTVFEQKYFEYFIKIIKVCEEKGPIYLQIGKGSNSKVALFMPVGDNEGAGQIMCIKSSKCNWPCRICNVCKKKNIHIPGKIIIYSVNKYDIFIK